MRAEGKREEETHIVKQSEEEEEEEGEEDDEDAPKWPPRLLNALITLLSLPALFHYMCLFLPFPVSSHGKGF